MKDLFITTSTIDYGLSTATGDIAGSWEADLLTTGSLAILDGEGVLLDDTTPSITTDKFSILLGTTEGIKRTPMYSRENFTYEKLAYVAPVAAVKYIGSDTAGGAGSYSLNLPSSIIAGNRVRIYVTDLTKTHEIVGRTKEYGFDVISGDLLTGATSRNIIAKLVAVINADSDAIVTAAALLDGSGNNDGMSLTCNIAGNDFMVSLGKSVGGVTDVLANAQIVEYLRVDKAYDAASTTAVASTTGQGTPAWLTALETEISTRDGNMNSLLMNSLMWEISSKVSSSGTYTVYVCTVQQEDDSVLIKEANPTITIYIAVPSADTGSGEHIFALDNILPIL